MGEGSGWVSGSAKIRELCSDKSVSQQLSSGQLEKCIGLLARIENEGPLVDSWLPKRLVC